MRFHAPYMEWAKKRPAATYDLAGSNVLACTLDDLAGARDALTLSGNSDNGYTPLVDDDECASLASNLSDRSQHRRLGENARGVVR